MKRENWPVTEDDVGPAGRPGECCRCGEPIGKQHKPDCPRRRRTILLRFSIDMVCSVPEDWGTEQIEFFFGGEGSYCLDNVIDDIVAFRDRDRTCLCACASGEYVREATENDEEIWGVYVSEEKTP